MQVQDTRSSLESSYQLLNIPMPCNLLIIDTETSGLDPDVDRVVELAAILYSVDHQTILHQMSSICEAQSNDAERINRIPVSAIQTVIPSLEGHSITLFNAMARESHYVVAHNADFDRQWFVGEAGNALVNGETQQPLRWLCTMSDFTWPLQNKQGDSLVNLALAHGIGVSSAHRALADCQMIASLFDRVSKDELQAILSDALIPRYLYRANVSYNDKQLAKDAGFRWRPENKQWVRKLTEAQAAVLEFSVSPVSA